MNKYVYVLIKLPRVTEEIARKLIDLEITDIRKVRAADNETLKKSGLTDSDVGEIRALLAQWG